MNKDYLTPSFNDENFRKLIKTAKTVSDSIENIGISRIEPVPKEAYSIISKQVTMIIDSLKPIAESAITIDKLIKINPDILASTVKSMRSLVNSPLFLSYPKLSTIPFQDPDLFTDFESFIKDEAKHPNQEPKQSCSQINSKSEENIKTESDKVENLNIAFINFEFHAERFKEVFHKSYSYASERKLVVFGVANAFAYLVTSAAQVHPLLPFWIFSIVSVIGLFTPRD